VKDIFVDNNIAKNFCNPLDPEYKNFLKWLIHDGALVISNSILREYSSSTSHSASATNISAIIGLLGAAGRLNKVSPKELRAFVIPKGVERRLRSNKADWQHLKTVLLSFRRIAITSDANLGHDIVNYPKGRARASTRPGGVPYRTA
jgi:hypothetical protein